VFHYTASATESRLFESELPIIETERLTVAVPAPEHAARMLAYVEENRAHLAPWDPASTDEYYTEGYWRKQLESAACELAEDRSLRLILLERGREDGPILGVCNYRNFVRGAFHACHLGYSIDHRREGHGLMREGLTASIAYVFESLNIHRIMANYMPGNHRSASLLRSLGFVEEGLARDYLFIAGRWQDHVLTSRTNPNWGAPNTE
jgi:ribosomal-protein-alanine N-acetyltransferase